MNSSIFNVVETVEPHSSNDKSVKSVLPPVGAVLIEQSRSNKKLVS